MSQRTQNVNEEIIVDLQFKVTINSFSNHDGFKQGQIEKAIEEFKENIKKELGISLITKLIPKMAYNV